LCRQRPLASAGATEAPGSVTVDCRKIRLERAGTDIVLRVDMASSNDIGRVLRGVLSLSLAPFLGACSSIDTDSFSAVACGADQQPDYLAGLSPTSPVDYLELRQVDDGTPMPSQPPGKHGEPCAKATDKAACEAKLAAANSGTGFHLGECGAELCRNMFLVVNAGDEVSVVSTADGVKALLGKIDAPAEAVMIAALAGYRVSCNIPGQGGVKTGSDGQAYEVLATRMTSSCQPIEVTLFDLGIDASGNVKQIDTDVIEHDANACAGRRPAGLSRCRARGRTRVGAFFAHIAHLEAASVHAFAHIEAELIEHGAPQSLIEQARAARRDEVRHARVMRRLARRHGGVVRAPRVAPRAARSLEEIALDNATEGCVRETFGALTGMWQARFAQDPDVRRVMERVAEDEARHASLAWAIDAWIRPMLPSAARQRIAEAQANAIAEIHAEAQRGHDPELCLVAGMPGPDAGKVLAKNFTDAITRLAA
jgi:hypothetical protein